MLSFRQKILVTYLFVFLIFIALMFPFAQSAVKDLVLKAMEDRTTALISVLEKTPNDEALITKLKEQKALIFFRVSVITNERKILWDSHTKRILGPGFSQDYIVSHPEVLAAFREGTGYHEEYSKLLSQDFAYFAKSFRFHGKTYVVRTAFPLEYIKEISKDFEFGFLGSITAILLLFSLMTWFIINYLTRPIQQIITAVKPYQEGLTTTIPMIKLKPEDRSDEFGQLANTLNSLSVRISKHITTLTSERNEKETVLESLGEGVIAVDNALKITFANTSSINLLKLKKEDLLGHNAKEAITKQPCPLLLEECLKQGRVLTDTLGIKSRGKKIYLDLIAAPTKDKSGAVLVLQDKTEHYRIIEMRKDFIANASHELKTPITIICGFAETLRDNPDLPKEVLAENLGKIVLHSKRMNNLIKDLLALTDIEHIPESRLLECDLFHLAQNAMTTVQEAYPQAQIQLITAQKEPFPLLADPTLLELALTNITENAAKYSPGAPPEITITLDKAGNEYTVAIADKGMGIPAEDLDNIFLRFYRVEKSRAKKIGGTGLGLSIVETIIEKHFGKITVQSEVGKGSTFTIFLPIKREVN